MITGTFQWERLWKNTERQNSSRSAMLAIVQQKKNCLQTLRAETLREFGVLPWERQETKDGEALRGCVHVLFKSVQVTGSKPKE